MEKFLSVIIQSVSDSYWKTQGWQMEASDKPKAAMKDEICQGNTEQVEK